MCVSCIFIYFLPRKGLLLCRVVYIPLKTETLQRLTLINGVSLNVRVQVRLPSLKTLSLKSVTYAKKTSLQRLLSSCPNLERLSVEHRLEDSAMDVTVVVPSLQRLHMFHGNTETRGRYVLDVPSLKYLDISDAATCNFCQIENMSELVTARVSFGASSTQKFPKAFTSVYYLTLRQPLTEVVNLCGMILNQLVHLDWRPFSLGWWDLLTCMLQYSPKLLFLKLIDILCLSTDTTRIYVSGMDIPIDWKPPSSVPECLLHSLEAFEWFGYRGRQRDKEMAKYVLKNATCLKTATFSPKPTHLWKKKGMLKELASVATASASAQILFH